MLTARGATPTLDDYQLRLPTFEGPLDVLLRLIERDRLEICEISLLTVFDQFMAFMHSLDSQPADVVADFATVAGRLFVLKSRALLPRPPKPLDDLEEPDLVRQLQEYRAVKAAAGLLADRQRAGSSTFGRGDGIPWPSAEPAQLAPRPPAALVRAVTRWLTRVPQRPVLLPTYRIVSLREMIVRIASALDRDQLVTFDCIRKTCSSRHDVAIAFLAMLTLLRQQAIVANQVELFGAITLSRAGLEPAIRLHSLPGEPEGVVGNSRPRS